MPLKSGQDKLTLAQNIKELIASGRPKDAAVAIAYANARRKKKKESK